MLSCFCDNRIDINNILIFGWEIIHLFLLNGAVNLASEFSPLLDMQLRISAENESDDRTYVVSANKVIHKLL